MEFKNIKYKAMFTEVKPISDWLACFHIYRIDPRDPDAIKKAPKFVKQNLSIVSHTLEKELGQLNINLTFNIFKNTTVDDFRYNMLLNIAANVCSTSFSSWFCSVCASTYDMIICLFHSQIFSIN